MADPHAEPTIPIDGRPAGLPAPIRQTIFLYLGVLVILLAFGAPSGGLIEIPLSFFLKNKLHLAPHEVANFRLIAAIPLYLSFVFGFFRDTWNPFGMADRGYMLFFGALTTALYVVVAFVPASYATLLGAITLLTASYLFVASAQQGLTSTIGQQHLMAGQTSAMWNIAGSIPVIAALLIGGFLSNALEERNAAEASRIIFLMGAAAMALVTIYAAWKPRSVFENFRIERASDGEAIEGLRVLARHWPLYPALLIWLLWNFAPGSATPLQYYLQDDLHANDAQWGQWNAIFAASFVPTYMLFGLLCRKLRLQTLLTWGTIVAVPQLVPLLFINSVSGALIAAVPIGLMGGVASAAYLDLIIRSCPRGLQGTTLMMSASLLAISARFGDILGTNLYDYSGGFVACVVATTAVYAMILPTLMLVPRYLTATADGQEPSAQPTTSR